MRRLVALLILALAVSLAGAGCSSGADEPSIVVYNAQHRQLIDEMAPKFTEKTGIEVELRNGGDAEMAAQLIQEGDASPADVFLTENSPAMSAVERAGLLTKLNPAAVEPIDAQFRPSSGLWTGFVARSTVLVYNPTLIEEAELPDSILGLADPKYQDKVSFSPTGADFQAIVAAVLDLEGEEKTQTWLAGLKANGTVYDGNNVVLEAVNSGRSAIGIEYHYYWYRDQAESGENSNDSKLYFFDDLDPGAFLSVSGAGVLASSKNAENAQKFVEFLTSVEGQQGLADSYALEYPLNPAVSLKPPVKPLDELEPPSVNITDLDSEKVVKMMTEAGFL